eukprot:1483863-Alexandrium_andersonii.AAC.1
MGRSARAWTSGGGLHVGCWQPPGEPPGLFAARHHPPWSWRARRPRRLPAPADCGAGGGAAPVRWPHLDLLLLR